MTDIIKLLIISFVMGVSSYAVGLIPLSFPLSPHKIQAISVLGSGILVGTALVVIIPEGVSMIFEASSEQPSNSSPTLFRRDDEASGNKRAEVGLSLLFGFLFMYIVEKLSLLASAFGQLLSFLPFGIGSSQSSFVPLGNSIDMSSIRNSIFSRQHSSTPASPSDQHLSQSELPRHSLGSRPLADYSSRHHHRTSDSLPGSSQTDLSQQDSSKQSSIAFGLVIHAIADGIALGASVSSGNSSIETIVFLAIMIHKAPASFGLAAVVLHEQGVARAKRALATFAAAAPFGALTTFALIKLLGEASTAHLAWWTGVLLLFSGGTFLYVAVHVMQELDSSSANDATSSAMGGANALLGIIGMLLPCLTLFVPDE